MNPAKKIETLPIASPETNTVPAQNPTWLALVMLGVVLAAVVYGVLSR